ncbi:mediator of RNA polymerase II transcription subunit 4-like [Lotus japonicus]|uniref:mediator of RNA polymerase II transcription subunit 4-like n=1 Tax=Lotus japonicus TaxID=34305 RepID=UPI00258D525A|nr:mediator of RNA polymerase II transcription subunit 4-like [Lotus japonicus]XP_057422698.1 mediator of RNA polymerase II transcription subunit 4-like [Lotus japonicus]XP_057422699.1 mediator of RNA polymerase II transcription subunit 4-like [Lotus japonicus]XP_057422700.1 mediator of RNA polymerase II transcription subunit 4-like [Lotus japonicus]XP_057422701.1 mediator of RNA polymerase II transcription subunit 4-like [Lotus japonicus]XP_057422702.1 mediator of RNA polymerase II transcript
MLQHQIVQSPARLGLTNPNSPSIPNPTPSKPPPTQTHNNQDRHSATPSAALLSLLPPLPRAQAILVQMASLTSKLFEVSSNRSVWVTAFRGSIPTFLSSQAQAHSSTPLESSPSSTKEIISLFSTLQTQIVEAITELQEILDLQDAKQKIDREIRSKDMALLGLANKLKDSERGLDILVDDYSDYRRSKRTKLGDGSEDDSLTSSTVSSQLKLSDILSYAHRISYTTFAPPEFGAGQAPLRGAMPPAPQDEQMRASQLYNFADLDIGLPKAVETKEKTIEAIVEPPPQQSVDTNPLANFSAIQGLLPPNFAVPPGWKPGMPVQLPMDIPIKPPPGWKPGDPVPLPPMDSLPVPRFEEQQLHPHIPQPKQPEVIQVQHVNLDLGGSDSSDYSSDEASSDDED